MIYLDNNATTPLLKEVIEEINNNFYLYGNPSSLHQLGREAKEKIEYARFQLSRLINCKKENIIFTSGGTESNNTVINSFFDQYKEKAKLIVSTIEHPSVLNYSKKILKKGLEVDFVRVDQKGKIILDDLEKKIKVSKDKKILLSIMLANNETGIIQEMEPIIKIAREYGCLIHSDMVQALGKIKIDMENTDVDYATFSSHKINGPKGVGAIYFKDNIIPLIQGGHQENGYRAGTENVLGIIGFGKACEIRKRNFGKYLNHVLNLRNILLKEIKNNIEDIIINTDIKNSVPNTLNISFKGIEGEALLLSLDIEGICVSTGSACSSGQLEPSHVLLAMGLDPEIAHGSIRFSIGIQNTEEEIYYTVEKLKKSVEKLRKISTIY